MKPFNLTSIYLFLTSNLNYTFHKKEIEKLREPTDIDSNFYFFYYVIYQLLLNSVV